MAAETEQVCVVRNIDKFSFSDEGGGGVVSVTIPVLINNDATSLVLRMKKRELAKLATFILEQAQIRQDEFRTDTRIVYTP